MDEYEWATFRNEFRDNNGNGSLQGDQLSDNKVIGVTYPRLKSPRPSTTWQIRANDEIILRELLRYFPPILSGSKKAMQKHNRRTLSITETGTPEHVL